VSIEDVRANMGWDPRISGSLGETPAPTEGELRLIRTQLDPEGMYRS
jgi:glutaconate CoA-transferase, subunit B